MRLTFYIIIPGRRKLRFETAADLDTYVKSHKLPSSAVITLLNESFLSVGSLLVTKYLQLEKEKDDNRNDNN